MTSERISNIHTVSQVFHEGENSMQLLKLHVFDGFECQEVFVMSIGVVRAALVEISNPVGALSVQSVCGIAAPVDYDNPLYERRGGGRLSLAAMILCYRNCVEGASATLALRQIGLAESSAQEFCRTARTVMA